MQRSMGFGVVFLLAVALAVVPATSAGAAVDEAAGALWAPSVVPAEPNWPDPNSVELGVRFITAEDTWISGVRFYKGHLNTGTHFGTLWTETGDLLATGEFINETVDGWQDLNFDAPVAIAPGQVYVASYWAPNGYYAATNDHFSTQEVTMGPITALQAVGASGNGVFSYSETSTFPSFSFRNTNYWVTPLWAAGPPPPDDPSANQDPSIAADADPVEVDEGTTAENTGTVSDPDGDTVTLTASVGNVTNDNDGTWSWSFAADDGPTDSQTVTISADDGNGGTDAVTFTLTVNNVAPTITAVAGPVAPVDIDDQSPVVVEVNFTDPSSADTHDVTWDWGDTNSDTQTSATSPASQGHTYAEAGAYQVTVTVQDDDGGVDTDVFEFAVIYDADGGFVTGGGWIDSPAGAYAADRSLTAKANFGFVSKYKKGASVPTGNTEFQFRAGDMEFKSTDYDWLVIASQDNAKYKGEGTINGSGNYGFMLTAVDNADSGDTFRIKIWDKDNSDAVVYDNQNTSDDISYDGTELGGGNIMVHKK